MYTLSLFINDRLSLQCRIWDLIVIMIYPEPDGIEISQITLYIFGLGEFLQHAY